ncbi:MAG: winged helix DNA-binding protein [Hymenobacter sp.]|nr:winged helix DNA-binding protein [Hymenobacter sp.]
MNSALLKDLLDLGDAYERAYPDRADQTLPRFLAWSAQQPAGAALPAVTPTPEPDYRYYHPDVPVLQTYVSHAVTKAYRYFRGYVKRVFETVPLLNFDDFITLAILAERGSLTKTHLVEMTVNEKTSGMLVIKRLIDNGFVTQTDDEPDKRTRRISVTPRGLATLRAAQPAMNQATRLFTGDLSADEQRQLGALLGRLDRFHEPIYLAHLANRDLPLDSRKETEPAPAR